MKHKYASHYVMHPVKGWLKQCVVEVEDGRIVGYSPLTDETENTEWLSGAIIIVESQAFHLYPFDFKRMQPVCGTQRRPLL